MIDQWFNLLNLFCLKYLSETFEKFNSILTLIRIYLTLVNAILLLILLYIFCFPMLHVAYSSEQEDLYVDEFGVTKIYPTKENGSEWFANMEDIRNDSLFYTDSELTQKPDGSWQVSAENLPAGNKGQVRLEIGTYGNIIPDGKEHWKNVEITGYVRVVKTTGHDEHKSSDIENIFQWYARGGKHSSDVPCEGTSLKGRISLDGRTSWVKEIWHTGGYTGAESVVQASSPLVSKKDDLGRYYDGRWIGFKVVIFNIHEEKAVRMESYIDEYASNDWRRASTLTDMGNWTSYNENFDDEDCGKPRNYVITNGGPIVAFRSDDIVWDFKNLSVREIDAISAMQQNQ
jgi:hypothetical protein